MNKNSRIPFLFSLIVVALAIVTGCGGGGGIVAPSPTTTTVRTQGISRGRRLQAVQMQSREFWTDTLRKNRLQMETSKAKQFLLEELGHIRAETLDDLDLAVQCQWANERAKKRAKDRFGEFERMIKELLEEK